MSIEVKELLPLEKVTDENGKATLELAEIIQRLVEAIRDHEDRITTLEP